MKAAMARPAAAPATQPFRWDALQVALLVVLFLQVWRIQLLVRGLPLFGLPILATAAAAVLFALDRDRRRRLGRLDQPVVRFALAIVVLVALSIPGALTPGRSLAFLLKDYARSVLLMLLIAASVRGLADVRRFAWVQIVGVSLCALAILTHAEVGSEGRLSTEATYYDANDLATLIVCTLPLVLYLWRRPTRWPGRLALAAATVFLITTLGETGSRGGFLGFVVVAGYLLLRFQGISRTRRVGAVALLVVLLMGLASDRYFERIETILHPTGDYNWSGKSETGRVEIWKRGVEYMLSHPALGVGAANFERAEGTLSPEARERQRYGRSFRWSTAHNSFIQIGAELGVFGVIFLVALVVDGFRMLGRIRRWPAGEAAVLAQVLTACLVGFVVTAMFLSQAYSAYLYALLGMCLGLSRVVSAAAAGSPPPARPGVWGPGGAFPLAGGISSPSR